MKPIQDRTQWHEYTAIERCQLTGKPVPVYSLEVENDMVWDSMKPPERLKLRRYGQLVDIGWIKLTDAEKKELNELLPWVIENDLSVNNIPENYRVKNL